MNYPDFVSNYDFAPGEINKFFRAISEVLEAINNLIAIPKEILLFQFEVRIDLALLIFILSTVVLWC